MTSWLHEERLAAAQAVVVASGASSVLDLGCGDGDLFIRLAREPQITRLVGIDLSPEALARLRERLKSEAPTACSIELHLASMTRYERRFGGFDCAVLIETIEHLEPESLSMLERAVFGGMRARLVVVTTPNAEFNPLLGVPAHRFRHPDHRFEWSRERFGRWAQGVAERSGYSVSRRDLGGGHPELGGASQMAVFRIL
ncbi:methyltransferase domain-containing protein [Phaeovulum sp.]|uniref:methyltransferase domain-containing protein n=1 Tax=Phaeovulum sp. TaxID=2934796 RepID=UPI00272FEFCB|nr:methyltransferase domain-containing protein [Phaeovulum sp.]MDP1670132.1 methyltransferase domain-containing protein [Phaeovulum sp.]MDZ4120372.1 methyltransferase domain-containing protein [Phaeovulum sp.]